MAPARLFFHLVPLALLISTVGRAASAQWSESGADFAAGTLGESGPNLYVNRHGEIETIRRYDLDGNGHLDLLFNSTHDLFNALPATLATWRDGKLSTTSLAVDGSSRVLAADLNRDGWNDLVFMPNRQNVQQQRSSFLIAWGGPEGWSTNRLTRQLPVNGVTSFGIADVDDDGWPDLLALNEKGWLFGQPAGRILRVYWGSAEGFLLTRFHDLGLPDAVELTTGHFGPQGRWRVAVLTSLGEIHFLHTAAKEHQLAIAATKPLGQKSGVQVRAIAAESRTSGDALWIGTNGATLLRMDATSFAVTTLPSAPATHLAVGELDGDEWPDVVMTDLQLVYPNDKRAAAPAPNVHIAWGAANDARAGNLTALHVPNAYATTVGDLDGDGRGDLLVAVHQGEKSLQAESRVLLGDGTRRFDRPALVVPTEGAQGVAVARLRSHDAAVAIFANSQHRTLDDAVPLRLYWGVPGGFDRERFVDIPNLSGYKSSAADLNSDGHVDMIVINGGDISEEAAARAPHTGINIYWGGDTGDMPAPGPTKFAFDRRQVLSEKHLGSINVADLNRDGYLDLVLGAFESADHPNTQVIVYYGSADGYTSGRRTAIDVPGRSIGCLIADFNRDGELDIVIGSFTEDKVITYWGSKGRYASDRRTVLPYPAPIDLEAADFNGDGWLELIVASYYDSVAQHHDMGSTIFWGAPAGWTQARSQSLPGMTPLGLAVADLDSDGHLDLVSPHYHGELSREDMPSYIFWGSKTGVEARRRTSLIVNSASEVVVADFDGDGKLDLAFAAHSIDPGHLLESPVFYNDGKRFASPRVQYLPAVGPHYMWVQDIGNIAHRRNEETFTSRVRTWDRAAQAAQISIEADLPHRSSVAILARSARGPAELESAPWREIADGQLPLNAGDRALQYRLVLRSANGDAYPRIRRVNTNLN